MLYSQAEDMKIEEESLAAKLSENRKDIYTEEFTEEEANYVNGLSESTIDEIVNSAEYEHYAETKKKLED